MSESASDKPRFPGFECTNENFYEIAWNARLQFIEKLISDGETNPYRIIKIIDSFDIRYELVVMLDQHRAPSADGKGEEVVAERYSGKAQWQPRPPDEGFDVLPTGRPSFWKTGQRGEEIVVPAYADYSVIPSRWLIDLWEEDCDCLVELGSGLGRNLFEVYYGGGPAGIPYYAAEISKSGRRITERLAGLDPALDITSCVFDHTAPDFSFLKGRKSAFMFTCHSIEQVPMVPEDYFDCLASAADKVVCAHFEPFGFQISSVSEVSMMQAKQVEEKNWNRNFLEVLKKANKKGVIKLTYLAQDMFGISDDSPTSIAVWRKA
jgi:hypothetical protein